MNLRSFACDEQLGQVCEQGVIAGAEFRLGEDVKCARKCREGFFLRAAPPEFKLRNLK
jgi:hypothetical protein